MTLDDGSSSEPQTATRRWRETWLTVSSRVLVVAMVLAIGARLEGLPVMYRAQIRAMMPAIIGYLQSPPHRGMGGYSPAAYRTHRVRWLCNVAIVFVRPDGSRWRTGMDVWCGDYDRRGGMVISEDGGDLGHEVMTLSGRDGGYRVLSARDGDEVALNPGWIDRNFPTYFAFWINIDFGPEASMPNSKALRAFGCKPTSTSGLAQAWHCASLALSRPQRVRTC